MYCNEAKKLLSEYLDGEISPVEKESLERHLKECASCSSEYQTLLKIHESFKTGRFHAPTGLDMRIIKSLPGRKAETGEKEGFLSIHPVFTRFAGAFTLMILIAAGALSGSVLSKSLITDTNSMENGFAVASLSLDVFDPAPRDSAIGTDLLMEGTNER